MHFDPYESKKAKYNRLVSNIIIIGFFIVFALCLIYIFFGNKTVKENYYFETVSTQYQKTENSEFIDLRDMFLLSTDTTETIQKDDDFDKRYPTASALLDFDEAYYDAEKPLVIFSSDSIVCAQAILSEVNDYRVLEVVTAKTTQTVAETEIIIDIDTFSAFSVLYNTRSGELTYQEYNAESFHMDIYSVGFELNGIEPTSISYYVNLSSEPSDSINMVYDAINLGENTEKTEKTDNGVTVSADYESKSAEKAKLSLQLDSERLSTLVSAQFKIKTKAQSDAVTKLIIN